MKNKTPSDDQILFLGVRMSCNAGVFKILTYTPETGRYRRSDLGNLEKIYMGNDYSEQDIKNLLGNGQWWLTPR